MTVRLVDRGWDRELHDALRVDHDTVRVVSPFIKQRAAARLLVQGPPRRLRIITRFDVGGFAAGVSDTSALRLLLDAGARIRGVKRLHAKVYLLGASHAIVTSANLTESGLLGNHEFGIVSDDTDVVASCQDYFRDLWRCAGPDLTAERIEGWDTQVAAARLAGGRPSVLDGLPDDGVDIGLPSEVPFAVELGRTPQLLDVPDPWLDLAPDAEVFVKFFGQGSRREPQTSRVIDEVDRSGCHWACTYPKHPWQVSDGSLMFLGRLVKGPRDVRIFGRAIGQHHDPVRDEATSEEIDRRSWKDHWRFYIRVHGAQFVDGTLREGVSLYEMMDELGSEAFVTTRDRQLAGEIDVNPRRAYGRQPAVRVAPAGAQWIGARLQDAFLRYGTLQPATLDGLDWPKP